MLLAARSDAEGDDPENVFLDPDEKDFATGSRWVIPTAGDGGVMQPGGGGGDVETVPASGHDVETVPAGGATWQAASGPGLQNTWVQPGRSNLQQPVSSIRSNWNPLAGLARSAAAAPTAASASGGDQTWQLWRTRSQQMRAAAAPASRMAGRTSWSAGQQQPTGAGTNAWRAPAAGWQSQGGAGTNAWRQPAAGWQSQGGTRASSGGWQQQGGARASAWSPPPAGWQQQAGFASNSPNAIRQPQQAASGTWSQYRPPVNLSSVPPPTRSGLPMNAGSPGQSPAIPGQASQAARDPVSQALADPAGLFGGFMSWVNSFQKGSPTQAAPETQAGSPTLLLPRIDLAGAVNSPMGKWLTSSVTTWMQQQQSFSGTGSSPSSPHSQTQPLLPTVARQSVPASRMSGPDEELMSSPLARSLLDSSSASGSLPRMRQSSPSSLGAPFPGISLLNQGAAGARSRSALNYWLNRQLRGRGLRVRL